jgi:ATP-dependent exoDNAse (exonuclease V) beta subunit
VSAACDELRSDALAFVHARPRDHWRRLRWLVDQARLFDETSGGTLRDFLAWAHRRAEEEGRGDAVGPMDPDDDAVRVMTVRDAAGLEFPVVVLAGLDGVLPDGPRRTEVLWSDGDGPQARAGDFRTAGFERARLRQETLDALERRRLLAMAMTRARDHLVVCLHHGTRSGGTDTGLAARVTRTCADNTSLWRGLPADDPRPGDGVTRADGAPGGSHPDPIGPGSWEAERAALLSRRRRPVRCPADG